MIISEEAETSKSQNLISKSLNRAFSNKFCQNINKVVEKSRFPAKSKIKSLFFTAAISNKSQIKEKNP
jgi:hypothetical protein